MCIVNPDRDYVFILFKLDFGIFHCLIIFAILKRNSIEVWLNLWNSEMQTRKKNHFPPQTNVHVQFCVHTLKKIHQNTTTNVKLKWMTIVSFRQLLEWAMFNYTTPSIFFNDCDFRGKVWMYCVTVHWQVG